MATRTPANVSISESGLCVEVLITEYSVGTAVISRTVVSRVAGFFVELFPWGIPDSDGTGVVDCTVVRTAGAGCLDVEKAYTVLSPVATISEPSALIAI